MIKKFLYYRDLWDLDLDVEKIIFSQPVELETYLSQDYVEKIYEKAKRENISYLSAYEEIERNYDRDEFDYCQVQNYNDFIILNNAFFPEYGCTAYWEVESYYIESEDELKTIIKENRLVKINSKTDFYKEIEKLDPEKTNKKMKM